MSPELIAICKQLLKTGKPVSVGMIKSRAPKNTPLPAIIQAVQLCKTQPAAMLEMETPDVASDSASKAGDEQTLIKKMAAKIEELEQRILALESRIER